METTLGAYFEDFEINSIYKHSVAKTVTESDNNFFCLLTMNNHPLHLDIEYAKDTQYGRRVVVGTYIISLVVGMSVVDISGKAIANLSYNNIKHIRPVFIGDTIRAETKILDKWFTSKNDRGIISVKTTAYNQRNECVLELERSVLLPLKEKQNEQEV
jgi:acyl dehydratase